MGYTPNIVVGMWVGNNENISMEKKVAGYIVAPMWRDLMNKILPDLSAESFTPPLPDDPGLKPIIRGVLNGEPHSILYFVDKNDPTGPIPSNPWNDPQFNNWEYAVRMWALNNGIGNFNIN